MRSAVFVAALGLAVCSTVTSRARAAELEIELAFEGDRGVYVPDTMGAVGPGHVVEITNGGFAIHRKTDGAVLASMSLADFWAAAGVPILDSTGDPRILYDPDSGRFFVVALNNGGSTNDLLLAVSNDTDPQLGFTGFAFDSDSTDVFWADFPMIGVGADTVTITSDMVRIGSRTNLPESIDVLVVPKADLLAPVPSIARATLFERAPLATTGFAPQPVTTLDGSGLPGWLIAGAGGFVGVIQSARVGGDAATPTLARGPWLFVTPHPMPPEAADPGGGLLDTGDGHFASPVRIGGSLWAVHAATGPAGRAALRWIEFDPDTLAVRQENVIEDPDLDFLYPSIAANEEGTVVIGFSASSAVHDPSVFAVLGETAGGVTRFGTPIEVLPGTHALTSGNHLSGFGDYSATVLDPSDAHLFWTFQEFAGTTSNVGIAALRVVPEPAATATGLVAALALGTIARGRRGARRKVPLRSGVVARFPVKDEAIRRSDGTASR
jgi:hypothetical protein